MQIITKEKNKFIYLKKDRTSDHKVYSAIYFEKQSEKFYRFKRKNNSKNVGFYSLFLAPLTINLKNTYADNLNKSYFIAVVVGIIFGILFLFFYHNSYSSNQLKEIELSENEIKSCIDNLNKIKKIKIISFIIWTSFFSLLSFMFYDEQNYSSLVGVTILLILLPLVLENVNIFNDNKIKNHLMLIISNKI